MKPDLTHYHGRAVEGIEIIDPSDEPPNWVILLNGDVRIINHDVERVAPEPNELGGMALLTTIFSELDTRLVFGLPQPTNPPPQYEQPSHEITLTPTKYAISDPNVNEGEAHFPQRAPEPEEEEAVEEPVSAPEGEEEPEPTQEPDGEE